MHFFPEYVHTEYRTMQVIKISYYRLIRMRRLYLMLIVLVLYESKT